MNLGKYHIEKKVFAIHKLQLMQNFFPRRIYTSTAVHSAFFVGSWKQQNFILLLLSNPCICCSSQLQKIMAFNISFFPIIPVCFSAISSQEYKGVLCSSIDMENLPQLFILLTVCHFAASHYKNILSLASKMSRSFITYYICQMCSA